ncbi:MAG TPA: MBL fold metallo-hydrolase, partial [Bacteroidia bacterium]|nr:MBL fold metallo-hydrolase [Bacteroidia bacterium]
SCFIDMQCYGKEFVFSGDIGREHSELLYPPTIIEEADYLIMESTYGDRLHPTTSIQNDLAAIINTTIQKNGNIVIPSFAVGRAQELMHIINALKKENHIPNIPVYMDSPMGADVLSIMERYPEWHKLSAKEYTAMCNDVTVVRDYHETDRIIQNKESKIIIAASGMITGGRVLEYLKHYVGNKKNTVVLVGYQAAGTRGRALQEGVHEIKLHGKYFMVNAYVRTISSLSGHGDQAEMINWLRQFKKKPEKIFLVHGEPMAQDIFRTKIKDEIHVEVEIPQQGEETTLFTV